MHLIEFPQSPESITRALVAQGSERTSAGWIVMRCPYCVFETGSVSPGVAERKWGAHVISAHHAEKKEAV